MNKQNYSAISGTYPVLAEEEKILIYKVRRFGVTFCLLKCTQWLKEKEKSVLTNKVCINVCVCVFLQSHNGFLYAGLMLAGMVIFAIMAMRYKYMEIESPVHVEKKKKPSQNSS